MKELQQTKELHAGKYLKWIPTNARISKSYTGIGGSTAEITAKRNSIILMPSLKAVIQKGNTESSLYDIKSIYSIYGGHNDLETLRKFLSSDIQYKKLIVTMSRKSIQVILEATKEFPELFTYNLLLDEVDQIPDDGNWREDLSLCYDLVSVWKYEMSKAIKAKQEKVGSVAVISATGVELVSFEPIAKLPLWKVAEQPGRNNFKVEILLTEELEATAATILSKETTNKTYVFYNNVDGSKRIINAIDKKDCRIYCGTGSQNKARELYSTDLSSFGNYNFCTKAYFRAVDFNEDAEIVIISDIKSLHAGLSVEDIVQSIGRCRKTIKKVTLIMNTKENKSKLKEMSVEKIQSFFRDIANQQLGTVKTLDAVGELTDSFFNGNEAVRKNIKGEFVINWSWIEGKVKSVVQDAVAYENVDNMIKALSENYIKAKVVTNSDITCNVKTETLDWSDLVEYVIKIESDEESIFNTIRIANLSDNEKLIYDGIKKLGATEVRETKTKYDLNKRIAKYDTSDRLSNVGVAVCKKFKVGEFVSSADAKKTLQDIYKLLGYEATAKATDLKEYFTNFKQIAKRVDGDVVKMIQVSNPKYKITIK